MCWRDFRTGGPNCFAAQPLRVLRTERVGQLAVSIWLGALVKGTAARLFLNLSRGESRALEE